MSPLIIDLDGDGVETTHFDQSSIFFDLYNTGFANRTAWVTGGDGLLALDRDGNGRIDNISELFGTDKRDGFSVLSDLDGNADQTINANDQAFGDLRIWIDSNSNGLSDAGELKALEEIGIKSISLAATPVDFEISGNPVSHTSTVTMADGSTKSIWDVWFQNSDEVTRKVIPEGFVFSDDALKLLSTTRCRSAKIKSAKISGQHHLIPRTCHRLRSTKIDTGLCPDRL